MKKRIAHWLNRLATKIYPHTEEPYVIYKEPRVVRIRVKKIATVEQGQGNWMKEYIIEELLRDVRPFVRFSAEMNPFGQFDIEAEVDVYDRAE